MSTSRDKLNQIFEKLSEVELAEIIDFAEFINNKRQRELEESLKNAPIDDEPLTEEEIQAIKEGEEDLKAGRMSSAEEVWKELDL